VVPGGGRLGAAQLVEPQISLINKKALSPHEQGASFNTLSEEEEAIPEEASVE